MCLYLTLILSWGKFLILGLCPTNLDRRYAVSFNETDPNMIQLNISFKENKMDKSKPERRPFRNSYFDGKFGFFFFKSQITFRDHCIAGGDSGPRDRPHNIRFLDGIVRGLLIRDWLFDNLKKFRIS